MQSGYARLIRTRRPGLFDGVYSDRSPGFLSPFAVCHRVLGASRQEQERECGM